MGLNRITINAKNIINNSFEIAKKYGYISVNSIHLLLSLLQSRSLIVKMLLDKVGVDIDATVNGIVNTLSLNLKNDSIDPNYKSLEFPPYIKNLISEAFFIASDMDQVYVGSEHLLLALLRLDNEDDEFLIEIKKQPKLNFANLLRELMQIGGVNKELNPFEINNNLNNSDPLGLDNLPPFIKNMTVISLNGGYPNITGRDSEIKRMVHILSRKTKNNPILVGDAGVGKTAIVEGFVNELISKKLPTSFLNKRVLSLDVAGIISGAKLRGDVEERIGAVINTVIRDENVILFIDEIHMIVGAGSSGGKDSLDIANILKPYLSDPRLKVVGATTYDEYRKYFESDSALARRFQPVYVDELDVDAAKSVLHNIRHEFEDYHKVKILPKAIDEAVEISKKFIKDRYLPDKAIDIIDEASASIKVGREIAIEPEVTRLSEELIKAQQKKIKFMDSKDLEKALKYKEIEESLLDEIDSLNNGGKGLVKKYNKIVTPDLVRSIVVDWTKIPIVASNITDKTLKNLSNNLLERIIGQDHVVKNVTLAIQKSHLGIRSDSKRPLASFLFLGPTGVGKTELAKYVAKELFGSMDLIYQVNMSEFMEQHSVSKLIGSPPGYIGYVEGGQLTNFVKRKPYSVILFDELEKAHPDILNIMLQILEEGQLEDGKGGRVSFSNTIVIMTSNVGAIEVAKDNKLGFNVELEGSVESEVDEAYDSMKENIMEQLKDQIRPELLNRFDGIEVFRGLNKQDTLKITELEVEKLQVDLVKNGIKLEVSTALIGFINEEGYSVEFGGRNIRRKIQDIVENGLAGFLMGSKITARSSSAKIIAISADYIDSKVIFSIL